MPQMKNPPHREGCDGFLAPMSPMSPDLANRLGSEEPHGLLMIAA
jgi:hypothetical protein